jgi:hypothetical protein
MYRLSNPVIPNGKSQFVGRLSDNTWVSLNPENPDNTDYANFKKDLADGAELLDSEGNVIDGIAYLKELA